MYRLLGNTTFVKIEKFDKETQSGIILLGSIFTPRGSSIVGRVVGIGLKEKPIKAAYEVGDLIVFQKLAATGVFQEILDICGADLKIQNVDASATLVDGKIVPLDDYVLLESKAGEYVLSSGIILPEGIHKERDKAVVVATGKNVKFLNVGDEVIVDLMQGSYVMTDSEFKISKEFKGNTKVAFMYKERTILAVKGKAND